jgi:hypothetical protein
MQIAYAAVSSAARVTRLGFTASGSVLSSIVTGMVVFGLWWATTSPIQSAPPQARDSKRTQQGEKEADQPNDTGTFSAGPSGSNGSDRYDAEPLQKAGIVSVEHEADNSCDGVEDVLDDGTGAYVSPLGKRLMVSADSEADLVLPHSFHVSPPWLYAAGVCQDQHRAQRAGFAT